MRWLGALRSKIQEVHQTSPEFPQSLPEVTGPFIRDAEVTILIKDLRFGGGKMEGKLSQNAISHGNSMTIKSGFWELLRILLSAILLSFRRLLHLSRNEGFFFQRLHKFSVHCSFKPLVLVAPYCAIPRDYLSDTPLACALWGFWCLNMANWVRYPSPFFWAFPHWRACEVEVRYPSSKTVSQRYLRDTQWKQGKWVRYPPPRCYLEKVLRDMGGYLALGR